MRGLTLLHRVRPCRFNNVRSRARAATAAARVVASHVARSVGYRQTSDTISFVLRKKLKRGGGDGIDGVRTADAGEGAEGG